MKAMISPIVHQMPAPLIEIYGDVWLPADIICIAIDEPGDGDGWMISIRIRGEDEWHLYDMDSKAQAQEKHVQLVTTWGRWLSP